MASEFDYIFNGLITKIILIITNIRESQQVRVA